MKIAIVGCGAMGSVYAGLFAAAGHEVWAIDTWAAHVEAMAANGLHVTGASGERTVKVNATTNAADAPVCDLVIIATKAMHVEPAAESARGLVGPDTVVLTIQNGLGSSQRVARILGKEKVRVGVVGGFGASIPTPGHVHHNGWELVRLGELEGPVTAPLHMVEGVWREAGFTVKAFDDIDTMVWEKLICNVAYSGSCALTGLTIGQVIDDEDAWLVASNCAEEAFTVAQAHAIGLGFRNARSYVRDFGRKIPNAKPSMLLDHLAGRRSEIEVINGAIPRAGLRVGVATPYNDVVVALVRQREKAFPA